MAAPSGKNVALELGVTVGAPTLILWGLTDRLGAAPALILALAFPLGWMLIGIARTRRIDRLALLALLGIGITGGVGLLQLDARWVALKEFLIPGMFAAIFAGSAAMGSPAIGGVLKEMLDPAATEAALAGKGAHAAWDSAIRACTWQLALIMLCSGVANAALAWWMLDAAPGTAEFNTDLSRLNTIGFLCVNLPTIAASMLPLQRLLTRLEGLTGVPIEDLMPGVAGAVK